MSLSWIFRTAVISAVLAVCFSAGSAIPALGQKKAPYTPEEIIAFIDKSCEGIESAEGTITRITEYGSDEPDHLEGTFRMRQPDRLFIHFKGETERVIGFDGRYFRIYFSSNNSGFFTDTSELGEKERFILGAAPYIGNMLKLYALDNTLELIDEYEGRYIVKAVPNDGNGGYVLIGISPVTWTVSGIEQFDKDKKLVRQTRVLEFLRVGDTGYFPQTIEISTVFGETLYVETTTFSDITFNSEIDDQRFVITGKKNTNWRERRFKTSQ